MRIALVIEHFDATRGGAEAFTVWLAGELARRGHDVRVICRDAAVRPNGSRPAAGHAGHKADRRDQPLPQAEPALAHVQTHRMGGIKLSSGLGFRLFGRAVRGWCVRHQPDIVHSISVAYAGDIYHSQAGLYTEIQDQAVASRTSHARAQLKRLLLRLNGKQRTLLALERRALRGEGGTSGGGGKAEPRRPLRIVSLGSKMTEQLVGRHRVDRQSIVELPNPHLESSRMASRDPGGDATGRAAFRSRHGLASSDRVAAFVGHDFRRKGLRYAIEAIACTISPWKLLVAGMGRAREYVELARRLGVGEGSAHGRVLFLGPIRDVDTVYAASDALLLPTFYDPAPLTVMESLAHGLPVVSTEFMGSAELVKLHGLGTIVSSPRQVEAMARALDALPAHGSPEEQATAQRARAAGSGITPACYIETVLELYETVRAAKAAEPAGR